MVTETRTALRDEQTELTRSRILGAVVRIMAHNVADLSVDAVAREAGVSRPTIYRYFKSKRDLVEAVGRLYAERLGTIGTMAPASLDELLEQTRAIFRRWETLEPELRAAAGSALGRELQARHLPARLAAMRRVLEPHARDLSEADRERLARVALIFFSSGMADLMRRYLGATVDEAAELVVWAVQRLIGDGKDGGR